MNNELTLHNLIPSISNQEIVQDKLRNSTFIGIDFGTSTTVVSYTVFGKDLQPIITDVMPIKQLNHDGSYTENHIVPSCIAWFENKLFIGKTAKQLKSKLTYGRNLWYSFKMKLGVDNGPVYFSSELTKEHNSASIENPLDATKVFFKYLKNEIDNFIKTNELPFASYYSISIPASFEANQRKDLKEALDFANIPFQDSLFIDEPNAAFLSYLIEVNSNNLGNYNIPIDSPLHILVFDFGAGTCDISILEIGRKNGKLYSKNVAISKFEQLGGDDIDKQIVKEILFPQLLNQNGLEADDIKTPEYNKIILPKLQPIAENLKIKICKTVASNLVGRELPSIASSNKNIVLEQSFQILLPKYRLLFENPSLSFNEFNDIIDKFTNTSSELNSNDTPELKSIYSVINSALKKGNIENEDIDLVLLIGGSSYNPYIQTSLYKYFTQSEIEIPRDLQSHVSTGAAVNSFLQNGLNVDMIKPIISEPILIILENNTSRILVKDGTEIPYKDISVNGLFPRKDKQTKIEIPICVSSKEKILSIITIETPEGFNKEDEIQIHCEISHDKLIHFRAYIKDIEIKVEPLNPFSNTALTTEQIAEKKILKSLNEASKNNGGRPPVNLLKELANYYVKVNKHQKAAETFETVQSLDPINRYETSICFHYDKANMKNQSDKWAKIAFEKNPNGTNAYNLALIKENNGDFKKYEELMEIAVDRKLDAAFLSYGEYLLNRDKEKANLLLQNAFDKWYNEYKINILNKNNYMRLVKVASLLGKFEISEKVKLDFDKIKQENSVQWYNEDNLASDNKIYLPEINE
ncbi:hypothetical protein B0A58_06385 [Flavobacterium branchiophilum NBRC 15030 = ATCC 35035]|uniref:Molecular chaperone DnaK (HSP70) n=1 Tax=Flavobacterium branchiophilum TaxID=55197 RepID=A0A543G845_9FLAO|nr:Hsp70 family protein [Flavobacterium branchiophilum]OXA76882.1 hypothetical protein B0A58_06385 [Flavobacterium branchiophilum NBRC 15030 = ATCC 35035]TQM42258.1 molecular chaperone DnaK (HSP70) [Flavobacterium branchiophilum]GEM54288.1 molecular chaperone DnaK [Flavobacterium branchiophilum NBRC 15030 = ATCC 35035]